jgi:hypothetical protein
MHDAPASISGKITIPAHLIYLGAVRSLESVARDLLS